MLLNKLKKNLSFFLLLISITLWAGLFFILPDFIDSPIEGFKSFVLTYSYWAIICFASFFLIYLLAINRYVFAITFPLFTFLGALIGYYRFAFKASLTPMIVEAVFNTYKAEAQDLISFSMIVFVLLSLLISAGFIYWRIKIGPLKKAYLHYIISILAVIFLLNSSHRLRSNLYERFPYNVYSSLSEYIKNRKLMNVEKHDFEADYVDLISSDDSDSTIVVLVLGESARAKNFSLNGYHRNTNPLLSDRENIYSFPHIYSEYTYTSRSLAHMLTRADSLHIDRAFSEHSFISLFNKSGYRTEWISNQNPSEGYVFFMNECDTIIYAHPEKSVYNFNEWYDEDLLPYVENVLVKDFKNSLLILHSIGSHWYYNSHFPSEFEVFQPITKSRVITQNTPEEIINSYDNTIVYTDYFLNELISLIEDKTAILIYISDHGELLGEDGKWLHAVDHEALKNPAALIWLSDKYIQQHPEKQAALSSNIDKHWRTDFLFHSILSGANIPSRVVEGELDVFGN